MRYFSLGHWPTRLGIMAAYPAAIMSLVMVTAAGCLSQPSRNQDMLNAIQEMQKTNYLAFVMLINMSPADLVQGNITFLMPSDKSLSRSIIHNVTDFLMRHSIPSPMLFSHLSYIQTDSIIPSLHPDYALRISNHGRLSFFLNNARLTSPNLCTLGVSVRCHGIDDVLSLSSGSLVTSCLNHSSSPVSLPSRAISPDPPPVLDNLTAPAVGPKPAPALDSHQQLISKSSPWSPRTSASSLASVSLTYLMLTWQSVS